MDDNKKFIPCIYLLNGKAVAGFKDSTIISHNPAGLARFFGENNADELIVFDLSADDASHEAALDGLKNICREAQIPVIGAGNVKRMEDIKKLLYAGCAKAALNYYNIGMSLEGCSKELLQEMRFNEIAAYEQCGEWENAKAKLAEYTADYPEDTRAAKEAEFFETQ